MMVKRVLVTPARVVRLPEEQEVSNQVLRHFKRYAHRFLRVNFSDENGARLCFASSGDSLKDFYTK